jgi:hypothetical protein
VGRIIHKFDLKALSGGYWRAKSKLGISPIYLERLKNFFI